MLLLVGWTLGFMFFERNSNSTWQYNGVSECSVIDFGYIYPITILFGSKRDV